MRKIKMKKGSQTIIFSEFKSHWVSQTFTCGPNNDNNGHGILNIFIYWIFFFCCCLCWIVEFGSLSKSALGHIISRIRPIVRFGWTLKKESSLWHIGAFDWAYLGKSILWMVISSCGYISVYIPACLVVCPVGWGCRIDRLLLCRGVRPPPNECPRYDTKQSDGEVPVMLELWGMRSTFLLPSLPGPLWPRVVALNKDPIYGLNRTKLRFLDFTLFCI